MHNAIIALYSLFLIENRSFAPLKGPAKIIPVRSEWSSSYCLQNHAESQMTKTKTTTAMEKLSPASKFSDSIHRSKRTSKSHTSWGFQVQQIDILHLQSESVPLLGCHLLPRPHTAFHTFITSSLFSGQICQPECLWLCLSSGESRVCWRNTHTLMRYTEMCGRCEELQLGVINCRRWTFAIYNSSTTIQQHCGIILKIKHSTWCDCFLDFSDTWTWSHFKSYLYDRDDVLLILNGDTFGIWSLICLFFAGAWGLRL